MRGINGRFRQRIEQAHRSGTMRIAAPALVSLLGCGAGGYLGWALAFNLNTYRPNVGEWWSVFFIAFTGMMFVPVVIAARRTVAPRFAVSWFVVAAAATYLWTSNTFDYDVRLLADPAEFGVFVVDTPEYADALTDVRLTVSDSDALLEVDAAPSSSPLFIIVAPTPPEYGCIEYGTFEGSVAYGCTAPATIQFENAVSYEWSGAALEAGGVSITTNDTEMIGELPVAAVPVDVTFQTHSSFDDVRIFNRPFLGVAAVNQYNVTFPADAQTIADDSWTAMVEYRHPRGTALLSIARDLSLILLGGAVSLFLIPEVRIRERKPFPATSEPPSSVAPADPSSVQSSEAEPHSEEQPPRRPRAAWVGALAVVVVLVALRQRRGLAL